MSVSRKNKNMKKSSKCLRSKNVKSNKKTRKNMKKMTGGGDFTDDEKKLKEIVRKEFYNNNCVSL